MRNTIFALFLVLTVSVFANNDSKNVKTTTFTGKVSDQTENLTGVKVIIDGKESFVYTDFDGNFTINDVPVGIHTISFSMVAYENKEIKVDLSKETTIDVQLSSK